MKPVPPAHRAALRRPPVVDPTLQRAAGVAIGKYVKDIPLLGQALELISVPGKLAELFGAGPVPDMATQAATALAGAVEVFAGLPGDLFGEGPTMSMDVEGTTELARRIKESIAASGHKWGTGLRDEVTFG